MIHRRRNRASKVRIQTSLFKISEGLSTSNNWKEKKNVSSTKSKIKNTSLGELSEIIKISFHVVFVVLNEFCPIISHLHITLLLMVTKVKNKITNLIYEHFTVFIIVCKKKNAFFNKISEIQLTQAHRSYFYLPFDFCLQVN